MSSALRLPSSLAHLWLISYLQEFCDVFSLSLHWGDPGIRRANDLLCLLSWQVAWSSLTPVSLAPGPGSFVSHLPFHGSSLRWLGSCLGNECVVCESGLLSNNVSLSPRVQENRVLVFFLAGKTLMKNEPSVKLISKTYAFSVTNKLAPVHLTLFNSSPSPPPTFLKFSSFPKGTWLAHWAVK